VSRELQSLAVSCVWDDAEVFAAAVHLAMCEAGEGSNRKRQGDSHWDIRRL
jgi:hypothetical protein